MAPVLYLTLFPCDTSEEVPLKNHATGGGVGEETS